MSPHFLNPAAMMFPIFSLSRSVSASVVALCSSSLLTLTTAIAPAWAQVGLSPLVIEEQAQRGQAQGVINVVNDTSEPFRARVSVAPFTYDRELGFQQLDADANDLSPYLQFSPRELEVPPNTTRRIRFVSQFPPSLPEKEYRAVILTESLVEAGSELGPRITLLTRIGATVYIRNGDLAPELTALSADYDPEQNQLRLLVQNTGSASVRPQINWTLSQGTREVYSSQKDPTTIVAGTDRYVVLDDIAGDSLPALTGSGYQLSGELVWVTGDNDIIRQPFEVNVALAS